MPSGEGLLSQEILTADQQACGQVKMLLVTIQLNFTQRLDLVYIDKTGIA